MVSPAPIAGIYVIKNMVNNKLYIGSTNNFKRREFQHFNMLKNNEHYNRHLQNAYNKYGKENFIFEVLEDLSMFKDNDDLRYMLVDVEDYYISAFDAIANGYNLSTANPYEVSPESVMKSAETRSLNNKTGFKNVTKTNNSWQYYNGLSKHRKTRKYLRDIIKDTEEEVIIKNKERALKSLRDDHIAIKESNNFGIDCIYPYRSSCIGKNFIYKYDKMVNGKRIIFKRKNLGKLLREMIRRGIKPVITDPIKLTKEIKKSELACKGGRSKYGAKFITKSVSSNRIEWRYRRQVNKKRTGISRSKLSNLLVEMKRRGIPLEIVDKNIWGKTLKEEGIKWTLN